MSNFAIGLVEPLSAIRSISVAAAAGTSEAYPFNAEPGLIYRSTTTVASGSFVRWRVDMGSAKPMQMLGLFGLPAVTSQIRAAGFSSTANQDADTPMVVDSGLVAAPLSTNRTATTAKALAIFNAGRLTARWWTIWWHNQSGGAVTLDVSRIALGEVFQPIDNVEWGLRFETEDTSKVEMGDTGYDDVEEQRILPMMSGVVPWGQIAETPFMRRLAFRTGMSREVVASLDPGDTAWGEDTTIWGRFKQAPTVSLNDYDVTALEFTVKAIMP